MVAADGVTDKTFVTLLKSGKLFWLNANDKPATKAETEIPAWGLATTK